QTESTFRASSDAGWRRPRNTALHPATDLVTAASTTMGVKPCPSGVANSELDRDRSARWLSHVRPAAEFLESNPCRPGAGNRCIPARLFAAGEQLRHGRGHNDWSQTLPARGLHGVTQL